MICPTLQREVDTQECRNNKIKGFAGCMTCTTSQAKPEPKKIKEEPVKFSAYIEGTCSKCGKTAKVYKKSMVCIGCARPRNGNFAKPEKKAPEADENFRAASIGVSVTADQVPFLLPRLEKEPDLLGCLTAMAKRDRRNLEDQILWIIDRQLQETNQG